MPDEPASDEPAPDARPPDARRWTRLARRTLADTPWVALHEDRVRLPNGHVLETAYVGRLPDWACVLAVTDAGEAVLVEQYRYGVDRVGLELPAGVVDPGEDPLDGARRELLEETGYGGGAWTQLGTVAPEPGRFDSHAHLFVARGVARVAPPAPDAGEDLAVRLVPAARLPGLAASGAIHHGVHVAAVFWSLARTDLWPGAGA